ncbi:collagen binding domain-containing protein [Paenibacillus segetis]|uniref:Gram-positive cocci surface proteins LPxTG domain-containing protein n=1 Tax=Paenibacillus segetis TaxID=1325360 RepID=A0ABQ1Y5Z4_9BACL|nr:collagen binding domain-containing protein [Paenibacillus segetis]GGH12953.1 hypothetical protein GCM10008013_05680 [Paenibacillus segetis]
MKKRSIAVLLAFLLVFQIFSSAGTLGIVKAAEKTDRISFTKVELSEEKDSDIIAVIKDAVENYDPNYQFSLDKQIYVKYAWKLEGGHDFWKDDTYTFNLPEGLKLEKDITGPLNDFGTFTAFKDTGKVVLTFNENVRDSEELDSDGSEVFGDLQFWAYIDDGKIPAGSNTVDIVFNNHPITVNVKPSGNHNSVNKTGNVISDPVEGKVIEWTIDVNKNLEKIDNAQVVDPIPSGLELFGAVTIDKLNVALSNGNVSVEPGSTITIANPTVNSSNELTINFADVLNNTGSIDGAYRITFKTKITQEMDEAAVPFENTAKLTGNKPNNPPIEYKGEDTVTITPVKVLQKAGGKSNPDHSIDWEIKYNFGERSLTDPVITDLFDNKHVLDGTVKVYEVDANGNKTGSPVNIFSQSTDVTNVTGSDEKNGFILSHTGTITKPYIIEYKTKPASDVTEGYTVNNNVFDNNGKTATSSGGVSQNFYSKSHSEVDYNNKTIKWTVHINKDKYNMTGGVYTDTFPLGKNGKPALKLVGNVNVTKDGNGLDGTVTPDQDGKGFTVTGLSGETHYTITYVTTFDFEESSLDSLIANYKNVGNFKWDQDTRPNKPGTTFEDTFTPNPGDHWQWTNNGKKEGKYSAATKTISWNIGFNYGQKLMTDAVITDKLTDIQSFNKDSLKIYEVIVNSNGSITESAIPVYEHGVTNGFVTVQEPSAANENTLKISFSQLINKQAYIVKFTTSVDDQKFDNSHQTISNTAIVSHNDSNNEKYTSSLTNSVQVPKAGTYISKTGISEQNDSSVPSNKDKYKINWEIKINEAQSKIKNVKVSDTPSENQILLGKNNFKLYSATYNNNNVLEQGSEIVNPVEEENHIYNLKIAEDGTSFELSFVREIDSAYILKYSTYVDAEEGTTVSVSNAAKLTADDIKNSSTTSQVPYSFALSGGTGNANALTGDVVVNKTGDDGKPLANVEFKLLRTNGSTLRTETTGPDGKLEFKQVRYGNYILKEVAAPKYYNLDGTGETKVSINAITTKDSTEAIEMNIKNIKKKFGNLTIKKVDNADNTKLLPGATFELYEKEGYPTTKKLVVSGTTGTDGTLTFNGEAHEIYQGIDYVLVEKTAPYGYYVLNNGLKEVILTQADTDLTIENSQNPVGHIAITKVDQTDNSIVLPGAEFELYHKDFPTVKVDTQVTGTDGIATFKNIPYGEYIVKESKAPYGYQVNATIDNITLNATMIDVANTVTATVKDEKAPTGELDVTKVAKHDKNLPLPNAEFELRDADGILRATGKTNAQGKLELFEAGTTTAIIELPIGEYSLKETKAPVGYILTGNGITDVKVVDGSTTPEPYKIENQIYIPTPGGGGGGGGGVPPVSPTPTPSPSPSPSPDPGTEPSPTPTPTPVPTEPGNTATPKPEGPKDKVTTPKDKPVKGKVDVPKDTTPKVKEKPKHGKVTVDPKGKWVYTPKEGYVGKDSFTIKVTDKDGNEEEYVIDVDVLPKGGTTGDQGSSTNTGKTLPKTGESSHLPLQVAGLALIVLGGSLLIFRKKRLLQK